MDIGPVRFNDPSQDRWAQKVKLAMRQLDAKSNKALKSAAHAATLGGTTTVINEGSAGNTGDDVIEAPTPPENFEAIGGFSSIFLQWDMPVYSGHNFTRIYRSSTNEFGDSVWIADVVGKLHSDTDLEFDTGFYYWARHVNKSGDQSALHDVAGAYAKTSRSYASVIEEAREDVLAGLAVWQNGIGEALDILDNQALDHIIQTGGTIETLSQQIEAVQFNADARYNQTVTTVANDVGSAVTKVERLAATLYETDENGELLLDETGDPIFRGAFIDRVDSVFAAQDGELMAAIGTTLSLEDEDGLRYSLSEIMELALDTDDAFTAQWGIKATINDLQYGVGLAYFTDDAGDERIAFHVAAHTFAVYNPANGDEVFPLIVNEDNEVLINTAIIDVATITTVIAETIITENLFATKTINSPVISGGRFFGGELNINDVAIIDHEGTLTAVNAYIKGKVEATSGYMENLTVRDSCTVLGTVYAHKLEGDVLDRYVVVVKGEYTVNANSNYTLVQGIIEPGLVGETNSRVLTISGLAFDHQGGGGSESHFDVALYVDDIEVQRFNSRNGREDGSVTVSLGAHIPATTEIVKFRAALETGTNDNILVQQAAILIDVTKTGETIGDVSALYHGSDPSADPKRGGGGGGGDDYNPQNYHAY